MLDVADAEDYRAIRLACLRNEANFFGSSYEFEAARSIDHFIDRLTTSTVFGAYVDGRIVGMAGFKQETGLKDCHKAFLWGMYVRAEARGSGIGSALVESVIRSARLVVEQLLLSVVQDNRPAIALYEKFGFRTYGIEPRSMKDSRGYSNEALMVLFFREDQIL